MPSKGNLGKLNGLSHGLKMWLICDETLVLERFLSWLNGVFTAIWNAIPH